MGEWEEFVIRRDPDNYTKPTFWPEQGDIVEWVGDPRITDTTDGPCKDGQCVGTVQFTTTSSTGYTTVVFWTTECKWHKGSEDPEPVSTELLRLH